VPTKCPYCAEDVPAGTKKCPHCHEWLDASAANQETLACPRCGHASQPAPGAQSCGGCGKSFFLFAGPRVDPERTPPGDGDTRTYTSKSSGFLLRYQAEVSDAGFGHGPLDPVTGYIPIDAKRIAFGDVGSIAIWSGLDGVPLVLNVLIFLPLSILLIAVAFKEPGFAICGAPAFAITAFLFWRSIRVGARRMRVCSAKETFRFRYDAPFWRWRKFQAESLRRTGIPQPSE
jgi:hypothetical protein